MTLNHDPNTIPGQIIKMVAEIVKDEMKKSLSVCPKLGCTLYGLNFEILKTMYPNECEVTLLYEKHCGKAHLNFKRLFTTDFVGFTFQSHCLKCFTKNIQNYIL
jgi:hypothetical protein